MSAKKLLLVVILLFGTCGSGYMWWKYRRVSPSQRRRAAKSYMGSLAVYVRHPWMFLALAIGAAVLELVVLFTPYVESTSK